MPNKVISFPTRKNASSAAVMQESARIVIHLGKQQYALEIPVLPAGTHAPPALKGVGQLEVQSRFLRLREPVVVGDRIDGWRVCWVGGWDKSKVLFVVMVERPARGRVMETHLKQLSSVARQPRSQ